MTLRADLIAAKALINTPYKYGHLGVVLAISRAAGKDGAKAARKAFGDQCQQKATLTHADIMAQFDRAIAAAGAP